MIAAPASKPALAGEVEGSGIDGTEARLGVRSLACRIGSSARAVLDRVHCEYRRASHTAVSDTLASSTWHDSDKGYVAIGFDMSAAVG